MVGSPQNWRLHCPEAEDDGAEAESGWRGGGLEEAQLENLRCRLRRRNHPEAHEEWGTDSCLAGEARTGTAGGGASEDG